MDPIIIFRHAATEGPGYFGEFLDRRGIPWHLVRVDAGEPIPTSLNGISGIGLMGGPMSVNDPLPWIAAELVLIRAAVAAGIPVIGHCLGGQLMARALGGSVTRNPVKEIGWVPVRTTEAAAARDWFGDLAAGEPVFHWHGETFSIPEGATRILQSGHCANQAFVYDDRHLAMQCHVEMTPDLIAAWCTHGADEIAASSGPAVQDAAAMQANVAERTQRLHQLADRVYSRWIRGIES